MNNPKPGVLLAITINDPQKRLYAMAETHHGNIAALYTGVVAFCSPTTHEDSIELLARNGAIIHRQAQTQVSVNNLGLVRQATIRAASQTGYAHYQMADYDRLLHWWMHYPDELREAIAAIPRYDFLIFGRTERAFATHPAAQQETESLATHAFELAWGEPWDITAGSRGLSHRAIERLLAHAQEPSVGNDGEWPLVLRRFAELRIGYLETEGLEFETADRYPAEIAALGSRQAWINEHYDNLAVWESRLHTAYLIVRAIRRAHTQN